MAGPRGKSRARVMTQQSFGRRSGGAPPPAMRKFSRPTLGAAPLVGRAQDAPARIDSVDEELKAWKKSRGPSRHVKLLALAASLSFGIASFALPETVNDWLQYPLYALSAASLYVGFRHKRQRR